MPLKKGRLPAWLRARAMVVDADDVRRAHRKIPKHGLENVNGVRDVKRFDAVANIDHRQGRG